MILAAWVAVADPARAYQFAPIGPEFQVHTTTAGAQGGPDVAMNANGDFIVVWHGATLASATSGGFAQRFHRDGTPLGAEFRFGDGNSVSGGKQSVAMAPDGRFVIVWSNGHEIIAKRYDAFGNELAPPPGVPLEVGNAYYVKSGPPFAVSGPSRRKTSVAMDGSGNFVVAWEDRTGQDGDGFGIFAKRYDAAGNELLPPPGVQGTSVGNEFQVNSFPGYRQMTPDVAMNAGGDFVITWWSFLQDAGFDAVMAKRYDSTGHEIAPPPATQGCGVGNEFQANTFKQQWAFLLPGGAGSPPAVALSAGGGFLISWDGSPGGSGAVGSQDCSSGGIFAKRFDASGNEVPPPPGTQGQGVGNEFQVNSRGSGSQGPHDAAMAPDGRFVISWYGYAGQTTARVMAKAYDAGANVVPPPSGAQGNGICNEFEATTFTAEGFAAVAISPGGDFVIVWDDNTGADGDFSAVGLTPAGIFARRYLGSDQPTAANPATGSPALICPPDLSVTTDASGQATIPDLLPRTVISGVCVPCAGVFLSQTPAPGTVVGSGTYSVTVALTDSVGHVSTCTAAFTVVNPLPLSVRIDIDPDSRRNEIKLCSDDALEVAIYSASGFDVRTIHWPTVRLADAPVKLKRNGAPEVSVKDLNRDGRPDVLVRFRIADLHLVETATQASLTGSLTDGRRILGVDTVKVVPYRDREDHPGGHDDDDHEDDHDSDRDRDDRDGGHGDHHD